MAKKFVSVNIDNKSRLKHNQDLLNKYNFENLKNFILITLLLSIGISQQLDNQDIAYNELKVIVETASRSQQTVWVEDFTGIM